MSKSKSRKKAPKRVLALPDLEHAKTAVLNSLTSASGRRTYDRRLKMWAKAYTCTSVSQTGHGSSRSTSGTAINLFLLSNDRTTEIRFTTGC
jgi:hypothetical protein